mmetsp:Transcript_22710/g.46724  ORF Transcript_22710/g.46724 Transcript_22710/m.46724 type:complete len:580 (+) Transcript_22710:187-1926(+)
MKNRRRFLVLGLHFCGHLVFGRRQLARLPQAIAELLVAVLVGHEVLEPSRHGVPHLVVVQEDAAGEDHQEGPDHQGTQHADLDLVGGDLQQNADSGGDGLHVVGPVDVLHALNHEDSHHHQCGAGGEGGNRGQERGKEDADEVHESDDQSREPCSPTFVDAGHGLAVGGHGAGSQEASHEGADGIGHEGRIASRESLRLLRVDQATEVCGCVEEAHRADEVDVQQGEQRVPEALPVAEARRVPSEDRATRHVAGEAVAVRIAAVPAVERCHQVSGHLDERNGGDGGGGAESLRDTARPTDAALAELVKDKRLRGSALVGHGSPAACLDQHRAEAGRIEATHHGMAGVGAAAIEGGVAASCDALEVEAASVVHRRASIGDGVDTVRKRHGGRGIPTEAHARVCLLHLSLSWHSVRVLARGLRVVSAAGLRIPLHAPGRRLRVRHAAQAAHGLVGELLHGSRIQDPRQDGAKQDHDHHGRPHAQEDQQAHEAEESDADPRAQEVLSGQRHEVHKHSRMIPNDVDAIARLQPDEGQEQADASHRCLHHPSGKHVEDVPAKIEEGHQDEDHTLDGHGKHHLLH